MADKKISDLTEKTSSVDADLMLITDSESASDKSKSLKKENLFKTVGDIEQIDDAYINNEDAYFSAGDANSLRISTNAYYENGAWVFPGATPGLLMQMQGTTGDVSFFKHDGAGGFTEFFRYDDSDTQFEVTGGVFVTDYVAIGESQILDAALTVKQGGLTSSDGVIIRETGGSNMRFWHDGTVAHIGVDSTNVMNLKNTGKVGLGLGDPQEKLHVYSSGTLGADGKLRVGPTGSTTGVEIYYDSASGDIYMDQLFDNAAGDMIFRTRTSGTPETILKMGNSYLFAPTTYSNTVTSSRDLEIQSNGGIGYVVSSKKYKENFDYEADSSFIHDIEVCTFTYKNGDGKKEWGAIAEQVYEVNPDFCIVDVDEDGNESIESIHYKKLISPMLKEIQKLVKENDDFKLRLEALEAK